MPATMPYEPLGTPPLPPGAAHPPGARPRPQPTRPARPPAAADPPAQPPLRLTRPSVPGRT